MKFMENPVARELSQQGWRSKYLNRGSLSAILGTGVHAAVAEHCRLGKRAKTLLPKDIYHENYLEDIYDIAKNTVTHELDSLLRLGALVGTRDAELAATLPLKARTTARLFVEQDPLGEKGWPVKDVELSLPDYGWCRLDMVIEPYPGVIAGLDWKVKLRLDPRYEQQEIEGFAYNWQFMHYAWALGQHYNTTIKEFYVGWICLEPKFRVQILEYFIDPELMSLWEQSAKTVWAIMAAVDGDAGDILYLLDENPNYTGPDMSGPSYSNPPPSTTPSTGSPATDERSTLTQY